MKNVSFFILFLSMSIFSQKYETHSFETLFSEDNFEIREYDSVMKARAFSDSGNNNFMKLFRYISGNNEKKENYITNTKFEDKSYQELAKPIITKDENQDFIVERKVDEFDFDAERLSARHHSNTRSIEIYRWFGKGSVGRDKRWLPHSDRSGSRSLLRDLS